jgi:predicted MFS family arabinose efflux permease
MTTEFLPGGLIPDIASSFRRPVAEVGQLVTVFAATVILATAPLAAATRRVPRKMLAVIALSAISAASALAALAPTFELLVVSRVIGGAAHGLFWVVAAAYAADLVLPTQLGRATAITAAGGSLASILGIPVGNALGQALGWRAAFVAIAAVGVVVVVLLGLLLPPVRSTGGPRPSARRRPKNPGTGGAARSTMPAVVLLCGIILFVVIGQTTIGTYSVVWLTDVAMLPDEAVPLYLLATGVAALVALALVGRLADAFPNATLAFATAGVAALVACFPLAAAAGLIPLIAVAITQAMCFAVVPMLLQARIMRVAAADQRVAAATLQTTAFNVAIGGGAVIGGLVVSGFGVSSLPWVSALLTAGGLCALLLAPSVRVPPAEAHDVS